MGWLEGLLTGYADQLGDIRRQNAADAERSAAREGEVYKQLLNSQDPEVRGMAATGLLANTQPKKVGRGFGGWMGEMQGNPMYPQLMKYISTPQPTTTTTTEPGLPSKQTQGFLPQSTLRVPGQTPTLAQPTTSPTEGEGMSKPQPLPGSVTPPPAPPSSSALASRATIPFYDDSLGDVQGHPSGQAPQLGATDAAQALGGPPPAPPAAVGTAGTLGAAEGQGPPPAPSVGPPGFPTSPEGTRFVQQLQAPTSPSNGGWWLDDKGQQWTLQDDQILKAGQPPVTPPPAPPSLASAPLTPGPLVTRQQTTYALPHAFPTSAESIASDERARMHAEIATLQEAYRGQGDPDWQRRGFDAYLQQHTRSTPGVMEGDSQQVTGTLAHQLGVPEGTWMQPLYDKTTGGIVHWIPGGAKMAGVQKLSAEDEAAKAIGYPSSKDVPPADLPRYRAKLNELQAGLSGARAGAVATSKYDEEKKRINPAEVDNAARAIMADASMTSVFLTGRPQAVKDAIMDAITAKGGDINKISEATRSMAEMAKDILPSMDVIAADAQKLNASGLMGPISSRWNDFLAGTYGAADAGATGPAAGLFAKFRAEAALLQSAINKAHMGARGAGSPYMLEHMDNLLSAKRMDYPTFINSMAGFKVFMDQYAKHLPEWGNRGLEPGEGTTTATGGPPAPPPAGGPAAAPQAPLSSQFTTPLQIDPRTGKVVR